LTSDLPWTEVQSAVWRMRLLVTGTDAHSGPKTGLYVS
jgi:hypothetical protein